jgi:tetratricopeptide (TPR) repeat protein
VVVGVLLLVLGLFLGFIGLLVVVVGVACALIGILKRPRWYSLRAMRLSESELEKWRTENAREDAEALARFVNDQVAARELAQLPPPSVATREREVVVKETVLVKCEACASVLRMLFSIYVLINLTILSSSKLYILTVDLQNTACMEIEKQAKAYENKAEFFAKNGSFKEAVEEFKQAAKYWKEAERFSYANFCMAKAYEYQAILIQDEQAFKPPYEIYVKIGDYLEKSRKLLEKINRSFEASKIAKRKTFLLTVFSAIEKIHEKEYEKALENFEKALLEAQKTNDTFQIHFIQGFKHTCRSYVEDLYPDKIREMECAIKEFEGKWPTRAEGARANLYELNALNSSRVADYEKAKSCWEEARKIWEKVGEKKKAIRCELEGTANDLEKRLFSEDPNYFKLSKNHLSSSYLIDSNSFLSK